MRARFPGPIGIASCLVAFSLACGSTSNDPGSNENSDDEPPRPPPPAASSAPDSGAPAAPTCPPEFTRVNDTCVFSGGPRDPGFQQKPMNAWKYELFVDAIPGGDGLIDPGLVDFRMIDPGNDTLGIHYGAVSQSFPMPTFAAVGPLAAVTTTQCTSQGDAPCTREYDLRIGKHTQHFVDLGPSNASGFKTIEHCLGDRAYGGQVELSLRPTFVEKKLELDHLGFEPAPECPAPGKVANGDFEGAADAWVWRRSTASPAPMAIVAGIGRNGSKGLLLPPGDAYIEGRLSVPSVAIDKPAVRLHAKGNGARLSVSVDGQWLADQTLGDSFVEVRACLPAYTRGLAPTIELTAAQGGVTVDDVDIVSDAACESLPYVLDGGFEAVPTTSWSGEAAAYFASLTYAAGTPASPPHGGGRYASMTLTGQAGCAAPPRVALVARRTTVPDAAGKSGPALRFFYRATIGGGVAADAYAHVRMQGLKEESVTLDPASAWTERVLCIDPRRAGSAVAGVAFTLDTSRCQPQAQLDVDDVELTTDASCPAE